MTVYETQFMAALESRSGLLFLVGNRRGVGLLSADAWCAMLGQF